MHKVASDFARHKDLGSMADSVDQEISAGVSSQPATPETGAAQCARYADILVELGYSSREQADAILHDFLDSNQDAATFGTHLIKNNVISREQARACERALRGRSSIGGFSILEKVGQGGMGTVFRARQISMDRIVAVKILAPKFAQDPSFKQRFLNEARTCAKLSHLNIINGIDCGEDSGYTYFAMEFVEGRTVKQVLKEKGRLEPDEAFDIIRQMTVALSYAKKFDMVHRDIKPDNIMLTPAGVAKLCDLGLAMEAEHNDEEQHEAIKANGSGSPKSDKKDSKSTSTSTKSEKCLALGTPHYMSPEQARGEQNIDARSDIYSLGATFYHLILGETVFTGKTSTEVMMHHVIDEAPNPCAVDPEIPVGVGAVISKMMAKDAADRYANADALLADLDAIKNGALPEALGFNGKSSCAIPPEDALKRLRTGGVPAWQSKLPHAAAALVLGIIAYFVAVSLGSKTVVVQPPTIIANTPAVTRTTPTPSVALNTTHAPAVAVVPKPDDKIKVDPKPPVIKKDPEKSTEVVKADITKPVTKVTPPEPEKPPENITPPTPPPPPVPEVTELPRPEFKITRDMLYCRFLHECDARVTKKDMETSRLYAEMNDVSLSASYSPAKEDIQAELGDLRNAWEFETKILKKIADQKGDVEFSPELAKKWEVPKGRALGYVESRGLQVEIRNGFAFYISPATLPLDMILGKEPDASPLTKVQYNYARGNRTGMQAVMPLLGPTEFKRWERKLALLSVKENEMKAREEYKNLTTIAEAKSWKTFSEMVLDFQRDYATTATFKANAAQIRQWQEAALHALEPPSKWRSVFHAASIQDVINSKNEPMIELTYDFKTPEQANDFASSSGQLKVENGELIVPVGGGPMAHVRFIAPFATIQTFRAVGKTQHKNLRPFGLIFVSAAQTINGPDLTSPMLKLDPDSKTALILNMPDGFAAAPGTPPTFDWHNEVALGFRSSKGEKHWMVDEKLIADARIPKTASGGWIALWGGNGEETWSSIHIIFKPDEDWERMKFKKKMDQPSEH